MFFKLIKLLLEEFSGLWLFSQWFLLEFSGKEFNLWRTSVLFFFQVNLFIATHSKFFLLFLQFHWNVFIQVSGIISEMARRSCPNNCNNTRCQFHQHFYVQIFCTNVVLAAFSSYILALAKNLYQKCARKMLMKLTSECD